MNIRKLRTELGYTQIKVAKECGVSLSSFRMWEAGVTKPNEDNMKKLKEVLKVDDANGKD